MDKIKQLIKKFSTREATLYIAFGVLTTLVNLVSFYIMVDILKWEANISNVIAIILAILVAYITNKKMVFHSETKTFKEKVVEFVKFMLGRAVTMIIEFVGGFVLFKLPISNIISKVFLTFIVIILNFFISKFLVFKKS